MAVELDLSTGHAAVNGSLAAAGNDVAMGCGAGLPALTGPDVFFSFTLVQPQVVSTSLSGTVPASQSSLVLLSGDCSTSQLRACATDSQQSGGASIFPQLLQPGTYLLLVDSRTVAAAAFTLTVDAQPEPSGETCSSAIPVDASTASVSVDGNLYTHSNDVSLGCESGQQAPNGPDLFYAVQLDVDRVLSMSVTTPALNSEMGVVVLNGGCGNLSLKTCQTDLMRDGNVALAPAIYPAGIHYVAIDSRFTPTTDAPYIFDVVSTPIPHGATCGVAIAVDLAPGSATFTGDLAEHTGEDASGCESGQDRLYGPEVFYALAIPTPGTLTATLSTASTTSELGVVLFSGACTTLQQVRCDTDAARLGDAVFSTAVNAGTYVLTVDSRYRGTGSMPFTVDLQLAP